jgi:hypothetical protein
MLSLLSVVFVTMLYDCNNIMRKCSRLLHGNYKYERIRTEHTITIQLRKLHKVLHKNIKCAIYIYRYTYNIAIHA